MAGFKIAPETITGKVRTRTPTQAQALSSRYTFLNLQNAEPNLGKPGPAGISPDSYEGYDGLRYALLSNNSNGLSAWRVWSFDNPRVAFYSIENSLGIGENANPIRVNSIVYNNHPYGTNRYNSESLAENSFNVYSLSGIYLFDSTTVGDPASAITFVVTESGFVGINTEFPNTELTVNGGISASGFLSAGNDHFNPLGWHNLAGSLKEGSDTNFVTVFNTHAEGTDTGSLGAGSHSEGYGTNATGDYSHAEGRNSSTGEHVYYSNYNSLTRVYTFSSSTSAKFNNVTGGYYLRGSYYNTTEWKPFTIEVRNRDTVNGAITAVNDINPSNFSGYLVAPFTGTYAHAEGDTTRAYGEASHAQGSNTRASGYASHAEGNNSNATGDNSHAEGDNNIAAGTGSHAEGNFTVAFGNASHAEGSLTEARGLYSHAEGNSSVALGYSSHASGQNSTAAQDYTFIWADGNLQTVVQNISTTRTGQFAVSASGGVFIPGKVGIGTDSIDNALTVNGAISSNGAITVLSGNSDQWNSSFSTVRNISAFKIDSVISSDYTFSDSDNTRTYHVDTSSNILSGIFPSTLSNNFSVNLILVSTNTFIVSSSQTPMLSSNGNKVNLPFSSVLIYKYNNVLYGLGNFY
jgi:hypothetical protein